MKWKIQNICNKKKMHYIALIDYTLHKKRSVNLRTQQQTLRETDWKTSLINKQSLSDPQQNTKQPEVLILEVTEVGEMGGNRKII